MAESINLTSSEKVVYGAIVKFIGEYGYAPSTRELCELTGYNSTSTIHLAKKGLEEKGYIEMVPKKNRAVVAKDVPKIVRCGNCRHRYLHNNLLVIEHRCKRLCRTAKDPTFFCAYGEEKKQ